MLNKTIKRWSERYRASRPPNLIIGGNRNPPYMKRWWVLPRNKFFNIYLHEIGQDDDDRALHDHPWWNVSYIVDGSYNEHTIQNGGTHLRTLRSAGALKFRGASSAHRLELVDGVVTTIFVTGPKIRKWGFHCPQGWRPYEEFVENTVLPDGTLVSNPGKGCNGE